MVRTQFNSIYPLRQMGTIQYETRLAAKVAMRANQYSGKNSVQTNLPISKALLAAMLTAICLEAQPRGGPPRLPDGSGRDLVQRVCGTTCHGPEIVAGKGQGKDQWLATVNSMVSRGAKISDAEFSQVMDYLVSSLPPKAMAGPPQRGGGGLTAGADDNHVVDRAASTRGRTIYIAECITCHGPKARGVSEGPPANQGADVVRSLVVLKDRYGSTVSAFMKKGHPMQSGNASAGLSADQMIDLAHFLHDKVGDTLRSGPYNKILNVLTGDAKAGQAYFSGAGGCTKCHSTTGDLKGVGAKYDPPTLQQKFLFPRTQGFGRRGGGGFATSKPVTVAVTANGQTVSGVLDKLDDFNVSLRDSEGEYRSFKVTKDVKVVKSDPYQAHADLLDKYTDKNVHDIVAYLESLK